MVLVVWSATPCAADDQARLETVREILAEVPLIDGHNDAPWQIRDRFRNHLDQVDFADTSGLDPAMHTDLKRLRQGGVGAQFWSVWVPTSLAGGEAVRAALEQIDLVHRLTARYPQHTELARSADDIVRIEEADGDERIPHED
jgi:membrane dipeptidase